jgi:hypothetical protein
MSRRLVAAAVLAAAVAVPVTTAQPANAAYCGPVLDAIGRNLPEPLREVYLKLCGV